MQPAQPIVEALAIQAGKIVAAGIKAEAEAALPAGAQRLNLHGAAVLPGLTDSHIHLQHYALGLKSTPQSSTYGLPGRRLRLRAYVSAGKRS